MRNHRVKDAQKPDHISLNTLIGRLKEGLYAAAHASESTSACSSTVRVAFSCLSGG